ncbi:MAG: hypothetical protein NTZ39_02050 [Methanoregula sp.]|nr:hypothetical protein [Methanoregula sp.]
MKKSYIMKPGHFWLFAGTLLLLGFCMIIPGCITGQNNNLTAAELGTAFLDHAAGIHDYRSEYTSTTDGRVRFDWKAPSLYRMEYTGSQNTAPGTIIVMNRTTAVWYDAGQKTYRVEPDIRFLPQHDYQAMVQQIVRDGQFTLIGRDTINGHTVYEIEVLTEPWSTRYTTYVSTKVRAWIDPASGLAWNISTYYPSDTVNNIIRYEILEANSGISDNHFIFIPPEESATQCGNNFQGSSAENFDTVNLSLALQPGCMDCTDALLTRPVGGFNGNHLLVLLVTWNGSSLVADPNSSGEIRYTFYAREMPPGKVKYRITRVAGLYATQAMPMPEGVTVSIAPDEIVTQPGQVYVSNVTVRISPDTFPRSTGQFWIYLHADAGDAIADDWVRVSFSDGSFVSGRGHFYTSGGGYCQDLLVVRQGESGHIPFSIWTGELDTGNVTLGLVTSPCMVDHGPLRPDERPSWPAGIHATITPDQFTGRSFASYLSDISFDIDPHVQPGDYCFSAILRTPTGGSDYAPFTVRVIPGVS